MNIDVKGHSGCNIDIIDSNGQLLIKKSTTDPKYINRLELQGNKQLNEQCATNFIDTPNIGEIYKDDSRCYILMQYIYANNFIDYFEKASPEDISNFISNFIAYINNELNKCTIQNVSKQIFIDKFNSVVENCKKNNLLKGNMRVKSILKDCEIVFNNLPNELKLPIGVCHGDLTFSNILFTSNKFYFIDYLDSFIETPLQDIVKLRQDTKYFWSTLMYQKKYDVVRLNIIFDYIDNQINSYFENDFEFYYRYYDVFQLMNILRILPYVKEEYIRDFVINILASLPKY